MKKFFRKYSSQLTSAISAIVSVLLAMLSNNLYGAIKTILDSSQVPDHWEVIVTVVLIVAVLILFFIIACIAERIKKKIFPEKWDDCYMREAFLYLKTLGANRQKQFQESQTNNKPTDSSIVAGLVENIQLTVESCFDFFDHAFSIPGELVKDIKFEVTFMTRSYEDDEITIPCSANTERRTPISMKLRKSNISVFCNTETAKIYKMDRPEMILIPDTTKNDSGYAETYEKQKERILSTIILPVLSHRSELLGTLVVHCNRKNFFEKKRYNFWKELLEIFSVEIGYQKLMLDCYIKNNPDLPKPF